MCSTGKAGEGDTHKRNAQRRRRQRLKTDGSTNRSGEVKVVGNQAGVVRKSSVWRSPTRPSFSRPPSPTAAAAAADYHLLPALRLPPPPLPTTLTRPTANAVGTTAAAAAAAANDLPEIQFGFYPSKKLYNGSDDARGQNPIPGKLNNLKHIIIRMMCAPRIHVCCIPLDPLPCVSPPGPYAYPRYT